MNRLKIIALVIGLTLIGVFLTSCQSATINEDIIVTYQTNSNVVFEHDTLSSEIIRSQFKETGIKILTYTDKGAMVELDLSDFLMNEIKPGDLTPGVHEITLTGMKISRSITIPILVKAPVGETTPESNILFLGVEPDTTVESALNAYQFGLLLDPLTELQSNDAVQFIRVNGDGTTAVVNKELVKLTSYDTEYARKKGGYITLEFNQEGSSFKTISKYVVKGEKPLHFDTAGWFDYVLPLWIGYLFSFIAGGLGKSYFLGILFTTIIVRTLAWPIYSKSNTSQVQMSLAQPEIDRVNQKYTNRQDKASQQRMQQETMAIYKKHKINAFGCLMPIMQMPIFIAVYGVVRRITIPGGLFTTSITNTKFIFFDMVNYQNSGFKEIAISVVLALIVGATMYLMQWISQHQPKYMKKTASHQPKAEQSQMQKTMKIMNIVMIVMMMYFSYQTRAIAIYWIIGNAYSIGQTFLIRFLNQRKHDKREKDNMWGSK